MKSKFFLGLALLGLLIAVPACGGGAIKTEGVSGVVTLDGEPLAGASVKFVPLDGVGSESVGTTNEKGEYKLQTLLGAADAGTTPGKYGVCFECFEEVETGNTIMNADDEEVPETEAVNILPKRYALPDTSGFEAEVVKGDNTFNFDLASEE
ncbi:MAG: carboxypeptidase regulatory-like domain-containing protein [Thermoguttaceae bacterium]|nr:carboxypeptidase regulatory-like domain-containing protein [Thermoguttaceae bacterium]